MNNYITVFFSGNCSDMSVLDGNDFSKDQVLGLDMLHKGKQEKGHCCLSENELQVTSLLVMISVHAC
jgi:hypothetical protein